MKVTSCSARKILGCHFVKTSSIILRPRVLPSDFQSVSQKLMLRDGLAFPSAATGTLYFLPLFVRALEKLVQLVEWKMQEIGAQKMIMPSLTSGNLFKKSGRWESMGSELIKLKDRHEKDLCLGPTHEESVTSFVANYVPVSAHRSLPIMLYQISTKFRDEKRPKFGALRGREFLMKDLYTFDKDELTAQITYDRVCRAYSEIFELLDVSVVKVQASSGTMGGKKSDEYHLLSEIGEDEVFLCNRCHYGVNRDLKTSDDCPQCQSKLESNRGIEVGQAFLLGATYSKPFQALYVTENGSKEPYYMGCYGLGLTRILAAIMEVLAKNGVAIRWPFLISPFLVGVIPPKKGSVEIDAEVMVPHLVSALCSQVSRLSGNILLDDRSNMTIGRRVNELKDLGIPFLIVMGKKVLEEIPKMEVIDVYREEAQFLTHAETIEFFLRRICNNDIL